ncbi:Mediator complex subunit Med20 [Penicillium riverlandense]|uniref:Mediator complex subunit Med20 n=1 Tax=Penicillium riverlandense TaxID=1903569 RepID=UPI00254743C3|nr:Mediator complex subunit Med20 [Penicillium riverlandense]KAJ5832976.1 Mediator complex subunit Med20 [Penicillium riverlandense]
MPVTGVYFVPSHPNASTALGTITERLRSAFVDEDLTPIGRWALEHKLMRDTPGCLPASANPAQQTSKPRYMQFLSLSHYPQHGFIYTSEPLEKPFHPPNAASPVPPSSATSPGSHPINSPGVVNATPQSTGNNAAAPVPPTPDAMRMTSVPPSAYNTLFQHFTYACQPFWCHRLTVAVPNGAVYDMGDFRVRVGDVRQTFPAARVRGTVVEIEWRGPSVIESLPLSDAVSDADSGIDVSFAAIEESDIDAELAATASLIREFWTRLQVDGGRESILVPGVGKEIKDRLASCKRRSAVPAETAFGDAMVQEEDLDPYAGADLARQYMEALRFNR